MGLPENLNSPSEKNIIDLVLFFTNSFGQTRTNKFGSTTLYYHDQNDGKLLGSLYLDTAGIADMAFDGTNLWVLDADNLVRIALPWAP